MAKKKKKEEHFDEGWLLPYSDLMTLLLAVFIVLFASSKVDVSKMNQMSQAFQNITMSGGSGLLDGSENSNQEDLQPGTEISTPLQNITNIKNGMDEYISTNHLDNQIYTEVQEDKLKITLVNNVLYESASAKLSPQNIEIANKIGQLLADKGQGLEVVFAGHTDNIPINNSEFSSNWDLSFERAGNFMRNVLKNKNLNPANFSASGYGEYKPIASNATEEGRSQNRRIEVLIRVSLNKE
ncbi:flagellar motor protein MotB [Clostridium paraputrificum]|uniref:flagellar motor protein MotB n=1 Tax=Clostridium paraputrificum TaxID=29363 RepID=UPI003D32A559